jgi:hypothetical protein
MHNHLTQPTIFVKTTYKRFQRKRKKIKIKTSQIWTNVTVRVFKAGLLARNQVASERSCDQSTPPSLFIGFLGPRVNAELISKFQVALHASYEALPMVALNISS